ncbi:hypothetical protein CGLO_13080 [Colletotrichum gloeosporioides Cg-14]|uniref:Uncharacterized protein n=1 Tax=Colletotrichum gloeosporioides (strain Cg-14) TaxID=1237896 RepID=T0LHU6_COLGC|nr:hypothetical protein CGLO_13080 [Colletotrichum gloeosporioides Cg-14]
MRPKIYISSDLCVSNVA